MACKRAPSRTWCHRETNRHSKKTLLSIHSHNCNDNTMPNFREPVKRKSNTFLKKDATSKRQKSMSKESTPVHEENLTPDTVINNLNEIMNQVVEDEELSKAAIIELKGFDASATTVEEYMQKREEVRSMVGDSEFFDRKTELNLNVASLAGAQLEVDKKVTTRRMSRKLHDECGIKENDILYKGLDYKGPESRVSKELRDSRKASIIESCVDFQKQMLWKIGLMEQVKAKAKPAVGKTYPMSDGPNIRTRGGRDKKREEMKRQQKELEEKLKKSKKTRDSDPFQTPKKKIEFNALDERRIIENYQLEVASEVRTHRPAPRRSIAPIPYNINILDDDDDVDD